MWCEYCQDFVIATPEELERQDNVRSSVGPSFAYYCPSCGALLAEEEVEEGEEE